MAGKYNAGGHFRWAGRIYDRGLTRHLLRAAHLSRFLGDGPFQALYQQTPGTLLSLPLTPEWLLLTALLVGLAVVGAVWAPAVVGGRWPGSPRPPFSWWSCRHR